MLIFLLLLLSVSVWASVQQGRIVGGEAAKFGEFPFMVSLLKRSQHFCGASLVSERFLITAAHCLCR